jgi:hypothetical protein
MGRTVAAATLDGWHGSMKPEGRRRWTMAGG